MNTNKLLFLVIVLAACLTQFAADIYAPSLPAIAVSFNTRIDLAQWSMAIYMYGVAASLLIYGPLSDGIGRKSPMILGLSIMLLGSLICLFAYNIYILVFGRFIQGCGAGACAGLWRSIFRDLFTGEQLAKYGSYFAILVMFIVPAAPALGGYFQQYFGWYVNFMFMSGYALLTLLAIIFCYQETSKHHHREKLEWRYIGRTFHKLLTSRIFMGITLCTFFSYGALFAWLISGPVLLIHVLGMSALAFGLITFLGGGIAYALAGWLNGRWVTRFGIPNMMRLGWSIMIISGLLLVAGKWMVGINVWVIVIPIILFYFGSTFIWPNAFAAAFTPFGEIAGYAGALYGFMQLGGGAIMGGLIACFPTVNQTPLALTILMGSTVAWLCYEVIAGQNFKSIKIR